MRKEVTIKNTPIMNLHLQISTLFLIVHIVFLIKRHDSNIVSLFEVLGEGGKDPLRP